MIPLLERRVRMGRTLERVPYVEKAIITNPYQPDTRQSHTGISIYTCIPIIRS
jgi:hypothetical protein